jgi:hypothetical protein
LTTQELLEGAIDLHVHAAPSLMPRYADDRELAREAAAARMGGFALKAHEGDTTGRAYHLQQEFPELLVFGGITLNPPVGGLNPAAVETSLRLQGKLVWLPTMYSVAHVECLGDASGIAGAKRIPGREPLSLLTEAGTLRETVYDILRLIRDYDAVLATGHVGGQELFQVVKAAHELGMSRILIMHPEFHVPSLSVAEQRELVDLGAMVEKCYLTTFPSQGGGGISDMAERILELGPEHCVLVTDFGQTAKGSPVYGMSNLISALSEEGLTTDQIRLMASTNPRRLLGLL